LSKDLNFSINEKNEAYILKFRNCDSYLFGTEQLLYFQDLREALKAQSPIEVVIKIVKHAEIDSYFPPLFNLDEN